ncbi:MAG: DUF4271 domain-containing protein [Bacteroidota bacterium]
MSHRLVRSASSGAGDVAVNPFDLIPHRAPGVGVAMARNETVRINPFAVMPRGGGMSGSTLFTVLLVVLAFLTFSVATNRTAVGKSWRAFLNDNALNVAQREASGLVGSTPYYMLFINYLANAGVLLFLMTRAFQGEKFNNLKFLLICILGTTILMLGKQLLVNIVSFLFSVPDEARRYNFLTVIFDCVLGLFLAPFNLMIAFTVQGDYQILMAFWMVGLLLIFYGYRTLRALAIGSKFLGSTPFHFLLYLCAVEIMPLLILAKLALLQAN